MEIALEFGYNGDEGMVRFEPSEIYVRNITTNVGDNGEFHGFDEMRFVVNTITLPAHQDKIIALEYEHISKMTLTTDKAVYVFEGPSAKWTTTNTAGTYTSVEMHAIK